MAKVLATGLAVALLALLNLRLAAAEELLANGGFEDGAVGAWPNGWSVSAGTLTTVEEPVHADSGSQKAGQLTGATLPSHKVSQTLQVAAGGTYSFSGWVIKSAANNVDEVYLEIKWLDAQFTVINSEISLSAFDSSSYQELQITGVTAPNQAAWARVSVVVAPSSAPFTVYMDDLTLQGPPAPSLTPTPTPMPTPTTLTSPPPAATPTPTPTITADTAVSPPAATATSTPTPEPSVFPSLTNGGFEEGRADGTPLAWRKFGGVLSRSSSLKAEGSHSAAFTSSTESTKWVYQTVSVSGGKFYELTGMALKNNANAEEVFLSVLWYSSADGSGRNIGVEDPAIRLTTNSANFRFLTTGPVQAPANARSARLRLMLRPRSAAAVTVYFDAITFTETAAAVATGSSPSEGRQGNAGGEAGRGAQTSPTPAPTALGEEATPRPLANVRSPPGQLPPTASAGSAGPGLATALALGLGLGLPLAGALAWAARGWWQRRAKRIRLD